MGFFRFFRSIFSLKNGIYATLKSVGSSLFYYAFCGDRSDPRDSAKPSSAPGWPEATQRGTLDVTPWVRSRKGVMPLMADRNATGVQSRENPVAPGATRVVAGTPMEAA